MFIFYFILLLYLFHFYFIILLIIFINFNLILFNFKVNFIIFGGVHGAGEDTAVLRAETKVLCSRSLLERYK